MSEDSRADESRAEDMPKKLENCQVLRCKMQESDFPIVVPSEC